MKSHKVTIDWILDRCERSQNGCLLWKGSTTPDGYGRFPIKGRYVLVHRVLYAMCKGEIPAGKEIMHTCDVPNCIELDHLVLGTHAENMRDMYNKRRNSTVKKTLSPSIIQLIRLERDYTSITDLAKKYGISRTTICDITTGKTWNHLK